MVYVKALGMRVQMWKELRQYFHWFESMASLPARFSHPVPFLCLGISSKVGEFHQHSTCEEEAGSQAVLTCSVLKLAMNSPKSHMSRTRDDHSRKVQKSCDMWAEEK